jgi:acetyltransferase-like isoleucine patch superfamily enzyme
MNLRRTLARSDHPAAKAVRAAYRAVSDFSVPAPAPVVKPLLALYVANRTAVHFARRVFVAEPLFKAYCKRYGKNLKTDIFVHWIQGKGDILVGDNVTFDGKSSITFAARFSDNPTLEVGDFTGISDQCIFTIGKRITLGRHVRVASGVFMSDSSGHPTEPVARMKGDPPADEDVRPITIHDNVWIGRRATILPGVTIGEGSIVSAGAIVMSDVAPYTIVAGNPARKIGNVPRPTETTDS